MSKDDSHQNMIKVEDLVKSFGPFKAVSGISFAVGRGDVLGFLGPNGAGKSTTMKMITGFLTATSGKVEICGHSIQDDPLTAQANIGYLPEGAPAYADMTPLEFLTFIASVRGLEGDAAKKAIDRAVERTQLGGVLHQSIETLSKGFKRRVGLAQAILHDPPVLIMDEPTDGLDPNQKHAVRSLISDMSSEKAIIISTHILEEVEAVCSRAMIIDKGRIVADGTPAELHARSKYHNAVSITAESAQAQKIESALSGLSAVASIEKTDKDDIVQLTAFSKDNAVLIDDISALAAKENWDIKSVYAEPGKLDEVFRSVTTSDAKSGTAPEAVT